MTTFTLTNGPDYVDNRHDYYGNDTWYAKDGNDTLFLGNGRDVAYGGSGNDVIQGGSGNDKLYGETGNNNLYGRSGYDEMYGGDGDDFLVDFYTDEGRTDIMYGGQGDDTFYTDGGKVVTGPGDDKVLVPAQDVDGVSNTVIMVGDGRDQVDLDFSFYGGYRFDVHQFTSNDKLTMTSSFSGPLDNGRILNILDRNDDGWLGP